MRNSGPGFTSHAIFVGELNTCEVFQRDSVHGRKSRGEGGRVPQNLEWFTLIQIVPPDIVMFQNSTHQITYSNAVKSLSTTLF